MSKYSYPFSLKMVRCPAETVVCCIFMAFCSVAVRGALTVVPVDRPAFVGERLKLNCSTNLTVADPIFWTRVNRSSLAATRINNGTQTIMSRYSIDTSQSNSYNLVIDPTEIQDSEYTYQCHENVESGQTARANLGLVHPTFTSNVSNDGVKLGEHIVLDCYVFYNGYLAAIVRSSSSPTRSAQTTYSAGVRGGKHEFTDIIVSQPVFGPYYCNVSCMAAGTLITKQLTIDSQQVLPAVSGASTRPPVSYASGRPPASGASSRLPDWDSDVLFIANVVVTLLVSVVRKKCWS